VTTPRATGPRPLWVVDPSIRHAETQGVGEILDGWPGPHRLFRPVLTPGDGPGPDAGYETSGVVLMGSAASVHEPLAWLDRLGAWLRPVIEGGVRVPLLGICFGHQLIAHLAGGEVGFLDDDGRDKLLGVYRTRLNASRLVPQRDALDVVVSHREEIKRLPCGYRAVASRQEVEFDGIEHVDLPIFGFQFHPEAREEFAVHAGIDPGVISAAVRQDSRALLGAFRRVVLDREDAAAGARAVR
jgi:GMP synthase-like glutamine amidotransferase